MYIKTISLQRPCRVAEKTKESLAWGDSDCQVSNRPGTTQKQRRSNAGRLLPSSPLSFTTPNTKQIHLAFSGTLHYIYIQKCRKCFNSLLNLSKEYMCSLYYSYNFFGRSEIFQKVNLK